jgi:hypothetical protein
MDEIKISETLSSKEWKCDTRARNDRKWKKPVAQKIKREALEGNGGEHAKCGFVALRLALGQNSTKAEINFNHLGFVLSQQGERVHDVEAKPQLV